MLVILLFFIVHWYFSLFMQTFLHHRYASHGAFTMSKFWERFFYLAAYITQGSSYVSPRVYAIMHRMHHAYADTENDPHSPKIDRNFFIMMWRARKLSLSIFKKTALIEPRFLKNLPDWRNLDITGHATWSRLAWMAAYVTIYILFAPSLWWFLLLPIHFLMVPVQGAIINWFAHKYGSVNFKMKNTSTNLFKVDLLMMGEAYHNNHHKNPSATNFGFRWYELDPTYFIMRIFNRFHIIRIHKIAVQPVVAVT
ncbi:MAG TPA: acyl-CoA desaturase [Chitinophagaceae bacterium]|nr:acyl-CoA desaturase [Chitinophagaceae bacterium]